MVNEQAFIDCFKKQNNFKEVGAGHQYLLFLTYL